MSVLDFDVARRIEEAKRRLHETAVAAEDRLHGRSTDDGDPRIAYGCELDGGHELEIGRPGNRCAHCREPWTETLLSRACVRRPAPLVLARGRAA